MSERVVMKKRAANFELLRIIAMMMIITLHFLDKGGILVPLAEDMSAINITAWMFESFAICAVNCYVLISGYFLVEAGYHKGRLTELICEILFYSLLIPLVMIVIGALNPADIDHYDILGWILPIGTEEYWFMTAYVFMYILAPILAAGVHKLERAQLRTLIIVFLVFECFEKTIIPAQLATDHAGYDFGWFICLFLIASYIRLYGFHFLENKRNAALVYILSSAGILAISFAASLLASKGISCMSVYCNMPYNYNYLLCLTASLGLFYLFKNTSIKEGTWADIIRGLAPYTLGVYLLHEHPLIHTQWPAWLRVFIFKGKWTFIPYMVLCVFTVYALGTIVDFIRNVILRGVKQLVTDMHRKLTAGSTQ